MSSPVNSDDEQSRQKWSIQGQHTPSPSSTGTSMSTPTSLHSSGLLNENSNTSTSKRKSAFLPYRPQATVLTNLQRGNTEAVVQTCSILSFHERAGQGELTEEQIQAELKSQISAGETIDFKDEYGFSPLHWASYYGQLHTVQLLLSAGATVDSLAPEMVTPLILAAASGNHEIVKLLLEKGAKANHMDIIGNTALMYAAAGDHPHTCNEILSRDSDLTATNEEGETAYSLAVENGSLLAKAVLEQYIGALLTF